MKPLIHRRTDSILALALLLLAISGHSTATAQTSADYLAQGRTFLSLHDLTNADSRFVAALALDPNQATGNVFRAATRLLALPARPQGGAFLDRLGVAATNRNVYHWTAGVARDTNGTLLAPSNVSASEISAFWRTNVLTELIGAVSNLARVNDTNFTLLLTSNETTTIDVTLDYGDIQMLKAIFQAAEYLSYTVQSWNVDVQLTSVGSLFSQDGFEFETMLKDHPNLLDFASTNDLALGRAAFSNAVESYLAASQFIRNRPSYVTRLFNLEPSMADRERKFRLTIGDLRDSLNGAVTLQANPAYSVLMASQFDGLHPLRSFLPAIRGTGFVLGTLPDVTFGSLIQGLAPTDIEPILARLLHPVPFIPNLTLAPTPSFAFNINTLKDRGYIVQISTNLITWADYSAFISGGESYSFADPQPRFSPRRFYRVVDRPLSQFPPPPNDNFFARIPLSGIGTAFTGYNVNATTEPNEPGFSWNSVWYSWTAPASGIVVVASIGAGGYHYATVFTGTSLADLTQVDGAGNPGQHYSGFSFNATAGVTYQIQVSGSPGAIQMAIGFPPDVTLTSPLDGAIFSAPATIAITASGQGVDNPLRELSCRVDGSLLSQTTNTSFSVLWTNVGVGSHTIEIEALDQLGLRTFSSASVRVPPSNDNFANRLAINGIPATINAVNDGASQEPGEPDPSGGNGGASVWWSWSAPASGVVTIAADIVNSRFGYPISPILGVYTGAAVNSLGTVASDWPEYGSRAEVSFVATKGVTYQIQVDGSYAEQGAITLQLLATQPPLVSIISPASGQRILSMGPTNVAIFASASDADGTVSQVDFYIDGGYNPIGTVAGSPVGMLWSNAPLGSYTLIARATDNSGAFTFSTPVTFFIQYPPPANDDFANRASLTGTNPSATGNNSSASSEPGEPDQGGYAPSKSVWWSWTAPSSGPFVISASTPTVYNPALAVYTGTTLFNLSSLTSTLGFSYAATLPMNAVGGQTYAIALDDYWGNGGSYSLTVRPGN